MWYYMVHRRLEKLTTYNECHVSLVQELQSLECKLFSMAQRA